MSERKQQKAPAVRGEKIAGSFRDPSGFVFVRDGALYRQVNRVYAPVYDTLMESGLYGELVQKGYLVAHEEAALPKGAATDAHKVIRPERIPFVSYPYEWCSGELRDAALLTLEIQKIALRHGMVLKDASAYNIQFLRGRPVLIDTLSFERYVEGAPWVAYKQFCEHFLAPLALMGKKEIRLGGLLRVYPNGLPLDLASRLLPWTSWLSPGLFFHIHMHAKSQRKYGERKVSAGTGAGFGQDVMGSLVANLEESVRSLRWEPAGTTWNEYDRNTNYSDAAAEAKEILVRKFTDAVRPKTVWDIGANEGRLSRAARGAGRGIISFDIDPASVEKNYLAMKRSGETDILPLMLDVTNPSPALGWANAERQSLAERGPADLVLALALVHHLAISNNVPFSMMADFFADVCRALVVEFVPKDDSQVERLLRNRADIFGSYTEENFLMEFGRRFAMRDKRPISGSKRTLYLMKRR